MSIHPTNLTPGIAMEATFIGGPCHGETIYVRGSSREHQYHRVCTKPPRLTWEADNYDCMIDTFEYRLFYFLVGDRIRPLYLPTAWEERPEAQRLADVWNAILDYTRTSVGLTQKCLHCDEARRKYLFHRPV